MEPNQQNRNRLIDTDNRLRAPRGGQGGELGKKGERIKQNKKPKAKLIDNGLAVIRVKGVCGGGGG